MIERTEAPLKDWPNSDLLLDDAERAQFAVDHPLLHRIFDFEELRTTFKTHDEACKKLKTATHSEGIYTLIIGAVGVIGPTRLNYGRIVAIVDYTAQLVGRLVSERS